MNARPLPQPDEHTAYYWEGAARGELLLLACGACSRLSHPSAIACRWCGDPALTPSRVGGRGTVHSYTVTHRALPGFEPPFVVALVALEEEPGVRLVTTLEDVEPHDVAIGMAVEVVFREVAPDVTLPLFRRSDA